MAFDKAPDTLEIPASGSVVLCTKFPAFTAVDYPANPWGGRLRFTAAITAADITIDLGYADNDGSNFVAAGPTAQPDSSDAIVTYSSTAQAITIPQGKCLALCISNADAASAEIITGGAWSYLSAPADSTVAWIEEILGDIIPPDGVDLFDYAYFANFWADTNCDSSNNNCSGTDLDLSGDIALPDLMIILSHWLDGK